MMCSVSDECHSSDCSLPLCEKALICLMRTPREGQLDFPNQWLSGKSPGTAQFPLTAS